MQMSKKGFQLTEVPSLVIVFVVVAVVMGIGATILGQISSTQCTYSYSAATGNCLNSTGGTGNDIGRTMAFNTTGQGLTSVSTLSGWQSTWAIIVAASVVLSILGLLMYFKGKE